MITKYLPDALLVLGFICLTIGAGMAWLPAGFLTAGLLMTIAGIKLAGVTK